MKRGGSEQSRVCARKWDSASITLANLYCQNLLSHHLLFHVSPSHTPNLSISQDLPPPTPRPAGAGPFSPFASLTILFPVLLSSHPSFHHTYMISGFSLPIPTLCPEYSLSDNLLSSATCSSSLSTLPMPFPSPSPFQNLQVLLTHHLPTPHSDSFRPFLSSAYSGCDCSFA